jgi:hypothetical protein
MACINLLGLNNELYCSHLQLKLQILEMGVQASLSDVRDVGQTMALSTHAENAAQLMRWIYDLVVLDPNEDTSKKASIKVSGKNWLVIGEGARCSATVVSIGWVAGGRDCLVVAEVKRVGVLVDVGLTGVLFTGTGPLQFFVC